MRAPRLKFKSMTWTFSWQSGPYYDLDQAQVKCNLGPFEPKLDSRSSSSRPPQLNKTLVLSQDCRLHPFFFSLCTLQALDVATILALGFVAPSTIFLLACEFLLLFCLLLLRVSSRNFLFVIIELSTFVHSACLVAHDLVVLEIFGE